MTVYHWALCNNYDKYKSYYDTPSKRIEYALDIAKHLFCHSPCSATCPQVLCNNLLPIRAPGVPETAYVAAAASFWEQLLMAPGASAARRASTLKALDSTPLRLSLAAADAAALLRRCAYRWVGAVSLQ